MPEKSPGPMTQFREALRAGAKGPAARAVAARPGQAPPFARKKPAEEQAGANPDAGQIAGGPVKQPAGAKEPSPDERIAALERELDTYREVLDALAGEVERMQTVHRAGHRFERMATRITDQITAEFDLDARVTGVDAGAMKRMHRRNVGIFDFVRSLLTKLGDELAREQARTDSRIEAMQKAIGSIQHDVQRMQTALAVKSVAGQPEQTQKSWWPWPRKPK